MCGKIIELLLFGILFSVQSINSLIVSAERWQSKCKNSTSAMRSEGSIELPTSAFETASYSVPSTFTS